MDQTDSQGFTYNHGTGALYFGRALDLAKLRALLLRTDVYSVGIVGARGIGKSTLAKIYMEDKEQPFAHVCHYEVHAAEVRNAVSFGNFAAKVFRECGGSFRQDEFKSATDQAQSLLKYLKLLEDFSCLMVVDNFELLINTPDEVAAGWDVFLEQSLEDLYGGKLLLTSQQLPRTRQGRGPHPYRLRDGLDLEASISLLQFKGLVDEPVIMEKVWAKTGGHPLALRLVVDSIGAEDSNMENLLYNQADWYKYVARPLFHRMSLPGKLRKFMRLLSLFTEDNSMEGWFEVDEIFSRQGGSFIWPWDEQTTSEYCEKLAERSMLDVDRQRYRIQPVIQSFFLGRT